MDSVVADLVKEKQKNNGQVIKNPPKLTPAIEERLKIIASIIIERVIEDQRNGSLRFKTNYGK